MEKYIAHASIDERGKVAGGKAGDQTKKEVCIRTMYYKNWNYVLRIKNAKVRKQFANNMIDAANNKNIGYDQNGRNTLLKELEKVNFDFSKITTPCECDCSSLTTICILAAIYVVLGKAEYKKAYDVLVVKKNCSTTSTLRSLLKKLGIISVYSTKAYTNSTSKAKYGDIYIREGSHVIAYIDNGEKVEILEEDGEWGRATTRRLQQIFGTTIDGKVSNQRAKYKSKNPGLQSSTFEWETSPNGKGSKLIKAMQKWAGLPIKKRNGEIDDETIKAFQKKLGTTQDGYVSSPSELVVALQKWANEQ